MLAEGEFELMQLDKCHMATLHFSILTWHEKPFGSMMPQCVCQWRDWLGHLGQFHIGDIQFLNLHMAFAAIWSNDASMCVSMVRLGLGIWANVTLVTFHFSIYTLP